MDRLVVLRLVASCNAVRRLKYSLILRWDFGLAGSSLHLDDQAQNAGTSLGVRINIQSPISYLAVSSNVAVTGW